MILEKEDEMTKKLLMILLVISLLLTSTGWYTTHQKTIAYETRNASLLWNTLTELHDVMHAIADSLPEDEEFNQAVFTTSINKDIDKIKDLARTLQLIQLKQYDIGGIYHTRLMLLARDLENTIEHAINEGESLDKEKAAFQSMSQWLSEILYQDPIGVDGMFVEANHEAIGYKLDDLNDQLQ